MPIKKKSKKDEEEPVEVYPEEEQGILPERSPAEREEAIEHGELDEDLDSEEGREKQVAEDEVEPWEAGFAEGASEEGQHAKDALTGEPLMDVEDVVEAVIDGKLYRFANEENAEKFRKKKNEKKE